MTNFRKPTSTSSLTINPFCERQTADSPFSHCEKQNGWLLTEIRHALELGRVRPGYKDGIVLVQIAPDAVRHFRSGVVDLKPGVELVASYEARRPEEAPALVVRAKGEKVVAVAVDIVLYAADVLEEKDRAGSDAEWHVISINAQATEGVEPMHPMAMARNELARLDPTNPRAIGGSPATYTADQYREAILYWAGRAMCAGK